MTHYARGAAFERRVRRLLEEDGWFVVRSAGSRGAVDLIALRERGNVQRVRLISCKLNGYVPPAERERLRKLKEELPHAEVLVARKENGSVVFERLETRR
ncbi:MAG: restriction endonuclease [Candidatus Methanospirareceae archaeon]